MTLLFVLRRHRMLQDGTAPLIARIKIDNVIREIWTGLRLLPSQWRSSGWGRVIGSGKLAKVMNKRLLNFRAEIMDIISRLETKGLRVTASAVKDIYYGKRRINTPLLEASRKYIAKASIDWKEGTLKSNQNYLRRLNDFLINDNKVTMPCEDFRLKEADDCYAFLRVDLNLGHNQAIKIIHFVKRALQFAVKAELSAENGLRDWKGQFQDPKNFIALTDEEVGQMERTPMPTRSLEQDRDMFLLQCRTGLSYADLVALKPKNLKIGAETGPWLHVFRQKNGCECIIPLGAKAFQIIEKYGWTLPVKSNQKYNAGLKAVADISKISVHLTSHIGRKTYATILANRGVSMEVIAKTLGHVTVATTEQYYAKVRRDLVLTDIRKALSA